MGMNRNRKLKDEDTWVYEDETQHLFAWMLYTFENFDIPALDDFIDTERNTHNQDILLKKREQAFNAYRLSNDDLLEAHLDYLRLVMNVNQNLPELSKKSHTKATSKGGNVRAEKDKRHQILNGIVKEYQEKIDGGYNFYKDGKAIHGRLAEFVKEMAKKYPDVEQSSIGTRLYKYRALKKPTQ